ncbi:putative Co/Zn/Cd efflux system membrane fusion protein [Lunatimonas lonarensis]|uniref:Putative Co/Zn/Cd efflux system membrane fusion protein n=1 Tax=Lunatimonas lonarensis TaxID=1232681 RepID=R7ZNY2_9BACT|nr:efflux RND transporter periplasmic adaptor subunit [Lunatimonas lonarensis]EON75792.1 putative Co/Zn/Cd efflux system membrane fusion protein [Lunatimonas lonarensis]
MKKYHVLFIVTLLSVSFACEKKAENIDLKKAELEQYQKEAAELKVKIDALTAEIAAMDPAFGKAQRKEVLVTTLSPRKGYFAHFVEVTGSVLSKKNVNISAEVAGRLQEVSAVEGMQVKRGQVLARIDAEAVDRNIDELKSQLELAEVLYQRQKRLWEQEIGTEIQFLEVKNRKENLEKSLASLQTQKDRTEVRAPFDGTVETVMVRLGELVQPGSPMINFVGDSDLFIEGDVSERYVGVLQKGDSVEVVFPSIDRRLETKVSAVGSVINPNNRTFKVEVFLPKLPLVKPNMISVLRINDYHKDDAVVIPSYLILQDNKGDYVFVVEQGSAVKRYIRRGMTQGDQTEILEGLAGSEQLVDKGFREVGNNTPVKIATS